MHLVSVWAVFVGQSACPTSFAYALTSAYRAGRNIDVSSKGILTSQPAAAGRWYLLDSRGASGMAQGCGGSTAYWSESSKYVEFHGDAAALTGGKTHNAHIRECRYAEGRHGAYVAS